MRARVLPSLVCLVALLAAVISGCGTTGNENADPAQALPASSVFSVTATIRPEGKQKDALEAAARKVGQVDDPGERVKSYVDDQLKSAKLSYQDDIEPWLGRKAGVGVLPARAGVLPQPVVLLASKDNDAARDALNKGADSSAGNREITYKDVKYHRDRGGSAEGVVGNFVVVGTDAAVRQVIDVNKGAPALDDAPKYKQTTGKLASSDRIAEAYADGPAIAAAASASNSNNTGGAAFTATQIQRLLPGPAAAGLSISDTKILVDGASVASGPAPTVPPAPT